MEWIPISSNERPKSGDNCLITVRSNPENEDFVPTVCAVWYTAPNEFYPKEAWEDDDFLWRTESVLAWMPWPDAYKEGGTLDGKFSNS